MRRGFKILLGAIVGIPVLLVAAFISLALIVGVPIFNMPDCGPNSPAVTRALALSQSELADLYKEMSSLAQRDPKAAWLKPESMPAAIRDLNPHFVHIATGPRITLEGCFDEFVVMSFYGLPGQLDSDRDPSIVLVWGEGSRQILWRPTS
jgi:hypothetical protein